MQGIDFNELYERISHLHEIEFIYDNKTYMIQPEETDRKSWLAIWTCGEKAKPLFRKEIPNDGDIPNEVIDLVLSEKCFDGMSFMEIEKDVTVTVIY